MKINLRKMQNKVDRLVSVFTNIIDELNTQIDELNNAIVDNKQQILNAEYENKQFVEKIDEYQALKDKVESIIK